MRNKLILLAIPLVALIFISGCTEVDIPQSNYVGTITDITDISAGDGCDWALVELDNGQKVAITHCRSSFNCLAIGRRVYRDNEGYNRVEVNGKLCSGV